MTEPTDTTAPGLRDQMVRLGYSVHQRSSHGPGPAFDYDAPWKGQMETRHFKSEEEAWADAERRFLSEVDRARKVLAVVDAPALIGGREKVANAARRLQEQLDDFDRDVADELESEGERADLWDDIDVSVSDLRTVLAALAQPSEAAGLEALRALSEKATPGEWGVEYSELGEGPNARLVGFVMSPDEQYLLTDEEPDATDGPPSPDAEFAVAAVNYVRAALSSAKPGTVGGEIDASPIINAAEEYLRNALSPGTDDFAARAVPVQEHPAGEALLARWCRQRAVLERERGAMDDASRFDVLAALASNPALPSRAPLPQTNLATPEPSGTDTESAPKPGELRLFDGQLCRFIERELEGDKWEVIGLFPAPGSNTPAGLHQQDEPAGEAATGDLLETLRRAAYYLDWAMDPNPQFTVADRQTITNFVGEARSAITKAEATLAQSAGEGEKLREALGAMLAHYGPPDSVAALCDYPAEHPITLARQALASPDQPAIVPGGEGER